MTELPTGAVTFLFTDIEGSTRLLQELGDGYGRVLAEHRAVLRAAFGRHGGYEFGTEGDASFVVFTSPGEALLAAAAAQAGLAGHDWPGGVDVRVRMGVHTGSPMVVDDDYVGLDVHRVARICSAGHGGQVLVSEATRALLADGLDGLRFEDLGWHRLKDLNRPEHLHQLAAPGLPDRFPPPRALPPLSNLPSVPTSFVGRERELAAVADLLADPDVRLVTLTGPGGTGKTRLALEAAGAVLGTFPDGVVFVPLATVADPTRVGVAVVDALKLHNNQGRPTGEVAAEHLRDRCTLLVLDNFEQVADAAGWVRELVGGAPRSKVLVTSRIVLNVSGEHEYPVRPLTLPANGSADPSVLLRSEAVALFQQRARAVSPTFTVDETTAEAVRDVCARLDGLPLAIELAASRLRLLSVEDLRSRLQARLPVLESRARDLPERQRTLRSTIDWSYRLLPPAEQALFRRLSVFVGGATLEAAAAVLGADADPLEGMETLVEHSLLWRDESAAGTTRYRMLATIREYATWQLDESGETAALRARHAAYFSEQAQEATMHLDQPDQLVWLAWYDAEMDNLRAALTWSLEPPGGDAERQVTALQLARSLGWMWYTRGMTQEALSWLERILDSGPDAPRALRATMLYWFAVFADRRGQTDEAIGSLLACADLMRAEGDLSRVARSLNALGDIYARHGDHARARASYGEALALMEDSPDPDDQHTVALVSANLGNLSFEEGDLDGAREHLDRGMVVVVARGDRWTIAVCRHYLARVAAAQGGRTAEAFGLLADALGFFRQWEDRTFLAEGLDLLAALAADAGDAPRSGRLTGAAASIRELAGASLLPRERAKLDRGTAAARQALGPDGWSAAVAEGHAMTLDQSADYALAWADGQKAAG